MPTSPRLPAVRAPLAEALVWLGALACATGVAATGLWRAVLPERGAEILALAAAMVLLAWPLHRWRGWSWATSLASLWLVALVAMSGVLPALAVALLAAAALAIGGLVAGDSRPLPALLSGLALVAALVGWSVSWPVHHWWTYAPLLALAVVLRRDAVRAQAAACIAGWRKAVHASPLAAAGAVLVLGIASTGAWLPTLHFDDLAYHLGLPWQLMLDGRYALDPSWQVWALAPWAGDVLQAVPQVVARAEARSALNVFWLATTAAGLWQLGALLGLRPALRWAAPALFASLPMTASLLGSMQTETAAAAVTVGLAVVVLDTRAADRHAGGNGIGNHRGLLAGALMLGLLCGLKPLHALAGLLLAAWAGWRQRRSPPSPAALAVALLLVLLAGGSSYAQAWLVSGNPVLPLFNSVFQSPWFPIEDFVDPAWQQGFAADTLWRMTFDTDAYVEGWDGAMGLSLVALAGAWLLALGQRASRGLALCATLALLVPLLPMQYARYLHPSLVLLLPALASALRWLPERRGALLLAVLCAANLALQSNAHWLLRNGAIEQAVLDAGADLPLFERYAPERALAAAIRERAPDSGPVLMLSQPFQAELGERGRNISWYAPRLFTAGGIADLDATGAGWETLLREERIAEVVLDPARLTAAQRAGLERLHARREMTAGNLEWWRIPAGGARP